MSADAPRDRKGLGGGVAADCRRALAESLAGAASPDAARHVAGCSFCRDRVRAQPVLAAWCAARPDMPVVAGADPAGGDPLLAGVYERVVDGVERGPLGEWLERELVDPAAPAEPVLQGSIDGAMERAAAEPTGLGELVRRAAGARPDEQAWSQVRRTILDGVAADRAVQRRLRPGGWRILLAGAAASAVIGLLTWSQDQPEPPRIVFADLERAPDVDFVIARYGSRP